MWRRPGLDDPADEPEPVERPLQVVAVAGQVTAGELAERGEERIGGLGALHRELVLAQRGHRPGEPGHGVVPARSGGVPGGPPREQPRPADALLRGGEQVGTAGVRGIGGGILGHRDGEPADLADRLGHTGEQLGPVLHQPLRAPYAARLLIGQEGQDEVTARDGAHPRQRPGDRHDGAGETLHVHRAPPVQHLAVPTVLADLGGERRDAPVRRVDRHDIQVRVHEQRTGGRVAARDPDDEVAPARRRLDVLARDAGLGQPLLDVAGGAGLAVPDRGRVAGVDALDADQVADDLDRLPLQKGVLLGRDGSGGASSGHGRLQESVDQGRRSCGADLRFRTPGH